MLVAVCGTRVRRNGRDLRRLIARQGAKLNLWPDTREESVLFATGNLVIEELWEALPVFDAHEHSCGSAEAPLSCEQAFSLLYRCDKLTLLGVGAEGIALKLTWWAPHSFTCVIKIARSQEDDSSSEQTMHLKAWDALKNSRYCRRALTRPVQVSEESCALSFSVTIQARVSRDMTSLKNVLKTRTLGSTEISLIANSIAKSLYCLHQKAKIMHGDVTTSNVFLNKELTRATLIDLGRAKKCLTPSQCVGEDVENLDCRSHATLCARIKKLYRAKRDKRDKGDNTQRTAYREM